MAEVPGDAEGGAQDSARIESVRAALIAVPLPTYMRSTGYDVVNVPFVTIRDSDGTVSTGFCYTLNDGASAIGHMISEVIAPALVGRTCSDWQAVRSQIITGTRRLGAHLFTAALSCVDIAVWDLRATRAGVPLFSLLGGAARSVPMYGSGRSGRHGTLTELVSEAARCLQEGYSGFKLSIGRRERHEDLARVAALRQGLGPSATLMTDAGERLTLDDALWLGPRCKELGVSWVEEPLPAEDIDGYITLSDTLDIAIATGEHFQGRAAFRQYVARTGVDIYQPDAALGGGISEMMAIAGLVADAGRMLAWHSLPDLHIHLAVSTPNTRYVEDFPLLRGIIANPLTPVDGLVAPSGRPGHGIAWDWEAIARMQVRTWTLESERSLVQY